MNRLIVLVALTLCGCAMGRPARTFWIGHPVVVEGQNFDQGFVRAYEIGFRPGGVVVWRKVKP